MASDGTRTMSSMSSLALAGADERALRGFATLMTHVCNLYTCGESSSVSEAEAHELAESIFYVLGAADDDGREVLALLASDDVIAVWTEKRRRLEARIPKVMELWRRAERTMPQIRNIALRDTLASIGRLPGCYDTFFAAHEVPCVIDYPLSIPVSERLEGLDYVEAWLFRFLHEAQFLARFDVKEMAAYLDAWCPDYRGLLINLYDPIHEAWRKGALGAEGSSLP